MSAELAVMDLFDIAIPSRHNIKELEDKMLSMPQQECPVEHIFAKGIYMRYITLPKDTMLTSKVHKTQHISIVLSGDVTISKPDGTKERVQGPHIFITEPNTKRAIWVHEETTWATFHVTDETDLSKLRKEIVSDEYGESL